MKGTSWSITKEWISLGNNSLLSRIQKATSCRPNTTGNVLKTRRSRNIFSGSKTKKTGVDDIINARKKLLLRGNRNITSFYAAPEGIVSSYMLEYKANKVTKNVPRTNGRTYMSNVMTLTPDPHLLKKVSKKIEEMKSDLKHVNEKSSHINALLKRAIDRVNNYRDSGIRERVNHKPSRLGLPNNSGVVFEPTNRTPMPVRVQNLMSPAKF